MEPICFYPGQLALLGAVWLVLQSVIVTLFWLGIRAYQGWIQDAVAVRDRALEINELQIQQSERQVDVVRKALPRARGRA